MNSILKRFIVGIQSFKLKGLKQGDILSALLFCIVIATVILQAGTECNSRYYIGGNLISNLSYADDIAAMSRSSKELEQFLTLYEMILVWVHSHYKLQLYVFIKTTHMMTIALNFGQLQIHLQVVHCPETRNLVSLLVFICSYLKE